MAGPNRPVKTQQHLPTVEAESVSLRLQSAKGIFWRTLVVLQVVLHHPGGIAIPGPGGIAILCLTNVEFFLATANWPKRNG